MGKKHITVSYWNESEYYNQSLDVARSPSDDSFLQHTHLLQFWMKKIHNDLMNWNEALQAWSNGKLSLQILGYSTLAFPMRYPSLYNVKERWLKRLGWSHQIREVSKIRTFQRPHHLLEDPLLEHSWNLTFSYLFDIFTPYLYSIS